MCVALECQCICAPMIVYLFAQFSVFRLILHMTSVHRDVQHLAYAIRTRARTHAHGSDCESATLEVNCLHTNLYLYHIDMYVQASEHAERSFRDVPNDVMLCVVHGISMIISFNITLSIMNLDH